jgi:hypothetical protein
MTAHIYTLFYQTDTHCGEHYYCGTYDTREAAEEYMAELQREHGAHRFAFSLFESGLNECAFFKTQGAHDIIYKEHEEQIRIHQEEAKERKRLEKEAVERRRKAELEEAHRRLDDILITALLPKDCIIESKREHLTTEEADALAALIEDSKTCANRDAFFSAKVVALRRRVEFNMETVGEYLQPDFLKKLEDIFGAAGVLYIVPDDVASDSSDV